MNRSDAVPVDALLTELLDHAAFLRRLAGALVSDPASADDLVQETWLAAVRHPPPGERPSRGWLATVLRNAARKLRRGEGRRSRREHVAARPDGTRSAADQAARDEVVRLVGEAVFRLEPAQRSAVLMRFYEGLPPREIAARTGVSVNTVRSRLRLALAHLREDLDGRQQSLRSDWRASLVAAFDLRDALPAPAVGAASLATTKVVFAAVAVLTAAALGGGAWLLLSHDAVERVPEVVAVEDPEPTSGPSLEGSVRSPEVREVAALHAASEAAPPALPRPAITQETLAKLGLVAPTPPNVLEVLVLDGLTPVETGTGWLWREGSSSGPEQIPLKDEPVQRRSLSREGIARFHEVPGGAWYVGVDLGDGVRRLTYAQHQTGKGPNNRSFVLLGDGAVHGTVHDFDGRLAVGVRVRAWIEPGGLMAETRTDSDGRYEIARLTDGTGGVSVAYSGDLGDPKGRTSRGLVIAGGGRTQVDIGSPQAIPRLVGTLRCPDGEPVLGERRLILSSDDPARGYVEIPLEPDGTYDQRVPAGSYRVGVWHASAQLYGVFQSTTLEAPLVVEKDARVRDVVLPGARIVGALRGEGDAADVRGAQVSLRRTDAHQGHPATRPVARDGSFRWHGLLPGRYELDAWAGGTRCAGSIPVVVTEGDVEIRQDLVLRR
jgi:RNA polymerase sigma factor (sigma-70 family)